MAYLDLTMIRTARLPEQPAELVEPSIGWAAERFELSTPFDYGGKIPVR
jgi:hypothetical protein